MAVTAFPTRTFTKTLTLVGTAPATAANFGSIFFIAPVACIVLTANHRYSVAGSAGSVMLTKTASGTAIGSGTACLSAGMDCTGTANTNVAGALHATPANYTLAAGDSLSAVLTGTPTNLANYSLTVDIAAT